MQTIQPNKQYIYVLQNNTYYVSRNAYCSTACDLNIDYIKNNTLCCVVLFIIFNGRDNALQMSNGMIINNNYYCRLQKFKIW